MSARRPSPPNALPTGKKRIGRPPSDNPRVLKVEVWLTAEEWLSGVELAGRRGYGAEGRRLPRMLRALLARELELAKPHT